MWGWVVTRQAKWSRIGITEKRGPIKVDGFIFNHFPVRSASPYAMSINPPHRPAMVELAQQLSSEITDMPTCAVAEFRFDAKSWSEIGEIEPAKVALDYPKKS